MMSGILGTALTGLQVTQGNLEIVARNVANADTPGYSRKRIGQSAIVAGDQVLGVQLGEVTRELDRLAQRQLRLESAGAGYAGTIAQFRTMVDQMFGSPGQANALDTVYNRFVSSMEALSASPESIVARDQVLADAQVLAQSLNAISGDIQNLRLEAEQGIADRVSRINELLSGIADINAEIAAQSQVQGPAAEILDTRDSYVAELSRLIDIRVVERDHGTIGILTQTGTSLLDLDPARLDFDPRASMTPQSQWSADPAERTVGTIRLFAANGSQIDLIADRTFRSGELGALLELRDGILVEAQAQLDAFAESLARSLSDRTVEATPTPGAILPEEGFDLDSAAMRPGDRITLTYTETPPGVTRTLSIVAVDDAGSLPLGNDATADPNDIVIGARFSAGMATAVADINGRLATLGLAGLTASNPAGTTLRIVDDGAGGTTDIATMRATVTETSLSGGTASLPFFIDAGGGGVPYSGSLDGTTQRIGFAGRIALNPGLRSDPAALVAYDAGVASGDPTRPLEIVERLRGGTWTFPGTTGIAGSSSFTGSPSDFLRRVVAFQGREAAIANRADEAQTIALQVIEERFAKSTSVSIDEEMARLVALQTAYQANARLIQAFKDMTDLLARI